MPRPTDKPAAQALHPTAHHALSMRRVALVVVIFLACYVIIPQLSQFDTAWRQIRQADVGLLGLAFVAILCAPWFIALAYKKLAFRSVPYRRLVYAQYAGLFINRLLPAGVGGLSLMAAMLYRHGHTLPKSAAVVAANSFIGVVGHVVVVVAVSLLCGMQLPEHGIHLPSVGVTTAAVAVGVVVLLVLWRRQVFVRARKFLTGTALYIAAYRRRKATLSWALCAAVLNTLLHLAAFMLALHALGVSLHVQAAIIVLSGGIAAATATPTPGGVLGAEAGLAASMIAYGLEAETAVAVALSYRLVSYWLPLLPGVVAFVVLQRRRWI